MNKRDAPQARIKASGVPGCPKPETMRRETMQPETGRISGSVDEDLVDVGVGRRLRHGAALGGDGEEQLVSSPIGCRRAHHRPVTGIGALLRHECGGYRTREVA